MVRQVTARALNALLRSDAPAPQLLDVREHWELDICRLDGITHIPMRQVPGALDRLDEERPVVVICHHGIRSQQVALYLDHRGFRQVLNLQGGMDAWAHEVDPATQTY
ncbi:MAG: sulfurtransferase [Thiohalocapsa sp.]|jgi:rhodanese-related sulfurtransferase|uniref:rhodanese-like domain-containing protein n=1 Tax=Thiohalocapsa sp. TaxID=2497641 RepID=UPI0025E0E4CA|nr:rhodanese-like domain-containing protein [Thiohalocapsa sp.]MCG6942435.1 sulfurtransferase [Thiohalocapsa sp.]